MKLSQKKGEKECRKKKRKRNIFDAFLSCELSQLDFLILPQGFGNRCANFSLVQVPTIRSNKAANCPDMAR